MFSDNEQSAFSASSSVLVMIFVLSGQLMEKYTMNCLLMNNIGYLCNFYS